MAQASSTQYYWTTKGGLTPLGATPRDSCVSVHLDGERAMITEHIPIEGSGVDVATYLIF